MSFDILSNIAGAVTAPLGQFVDNAFGITEQRMQQQQEQAQKLQDIQLAGAKEMGVFNKEQALDLWNKTNYEAQMQHLENAGLNPALLYGKGGGGGATTSGAQASMPAGQNAPDPASMARNSMELGMQMAQIRLMNAQAESAEADAKAKIANATKTAGADTDLANENIKLQKFQNAINEAVGVENARDIAYWNHSIKGIEFEKENAAWETFKAAGYPSNNTGDPNSPAAKAVRAGLDQVVTNLENAKKQGAILDAQKEIEGFKARLAEQGISPDSPWFVKIISDMLERVGLNPIKNIGEGIKNGVNVAKQIM